MSVEVVVGLQWGDEGKGKVVDYLAGDADIVARYTGGANAAHTVVVGDKEVYSRLVPSGVLQPHTTLVITDGVVIDPALLTTELEFLKESIHFDINRLLIGQYAPVTFPYHIELDRVSEWGSGIHNIGTTGSGIGPARTDQVSRQAVRFFEYLNPDFMHGEGVLHRINKWLTWAPLLSLVSNMLITEKTYSNTLELLSGCVIDTANFLNQAIDEGQKVIFEGSQGAMLDVVYGTYPYVTSACTLAGGVCSASGVAPSKIDKTIGVMKAYSTRVSLGPLLTEITGPTAEKLQLKGNEFRHTDHTPLRVGWLDLVALRRAIQLNAPQSIAITKLDVLDSFSEIRICIEYKKERKRYSQLPAVGATYTSPVNIDYSGFEPVYRVFEGWGSPTSSVNKYIDLPIKAQEFVNYIEDSLQVPIEIISVGRDRHQTIRID